MIRPDLPRLPIREGFANLKMSWEFCLFHLSELKYHLTFVPGIYQGLNVNTERTRRHSYQQHAQKLIRKLSTNIPQTRELVVTFFMRLGHAFFNWEFYQYISNEGSTCNRFINSRFLFIGAGIADGSSDHSPELMEHAVDYAELHAIHLI